MNSSSASGPFALAHRVDGLPSIAFLAGKLPSLSACVEDAATVPVRARSASSADTGEATPNANARASD